MVLLMKIIIIGVASRILRALQMQGDKMIGGLLGQWAVMTMLLLYWLTKDFRDKFERDCRELIIVIKMISRNGLTTQAELHGWPE